MPISNFTRSRFIILFSSLILLQFVTAYSNQTGLAEPTQEELDWFTANKSSNNDVLITPIGGERIIQNSSRSTGPVPSALYDIDENVRLSEVSQVALPKSVDNSLLKYFPPIRSQNPLKLHVSFTLFKIYFRLCTSSYRLSADMYNSDKFIYLPIRVLYEIFPNYYISDWYLTQYCSGTRLCQRY